MYNYFNTPLGDFIEKSLRGEVGKLDEKEVLIYLELLKNESKEKLQQALKKVEIAMVEFKDSYFVSTYQKEDLTLTMEQSDDLFNDEEQLRKSGKIELTIYSLSSAIEKIGLVNELHEDAIETARCCNDIDFLVAQWKDLILEPLRALQSMINDMLKSCPHTENDESETANTPKKQLADYPEVFGTNDCCEMTGYSKHTIYKYCSKGEIPYFKSGGNSRKLFFRREEIIPWMTNIRHETTEEYIDRKGHQLASKKNSSIIS